MKVRSTLRKVLVTATAALTIGAGVLVAPAINPKASGTLVTAEAKSVPGFPVLQRGSKGDAVKILQYWLKAYGEPIDVDGSFGPATHDRVVSLQGRLGIKNNGIVGEETWGHMLQWTKPGDTGSGVWALGHALRIRGINAPDTHDYTPAMREAVIAFQKKAGIAQDGKAGPDTWRALVNGGTSPSCGDPRKSYSNGRLPDSALRAVAFSSPRRISCYLERDFNAMNEAYRAAHGGNNIPFANGRTAYRTYQDQKEIYDSCDWNGGQKCAKPGTSNHGWGLAIDVVRAQNGWFLNNAGRFGFQNLSNDPNHWRYVR